MKWNIIFECCWELILEVFSTMTTLDPTLCFCLHSSTCWKLQMLSVLWQPPSCSFCHGFSVPGNHSSWCQGIEDVFRWVFKWLWLSDLYFIPQYFGNDVSLWTLDLLDLYYVLFSKILTFRKLAKLALFWNSGSPSHISSAWPLISRTPPRGARRNSETDAMDVILHRNSFFHLPGLPEDTLMEVELTSVWLPLSTKNNK